MINDDDDDHDEYGVVYVGAFRVASYIGILQWYTRHLP